MRPLELSPVIRQDHRSLNPSTEGEAIGRAGNQSNVALRVVERSSVPI